jgi:hypothetical protein
VDYFPYIYILKCYYIDFYFVYTQQRSEMPPSMRTWWMNWWRRVGGLFSSFIYMLGCLYILPCVYTTMI